MKKIIGVLAFLTIVTGTVVALRMRADAMPPPPLPVVKVLCDGANPCCNGTGQTPQGIREFVYRVQIPGGNVVSVSSIDVGTHIDNNLADYVNLVMPAGWALTIPAGTPVDPGFVCTPHGNVSAIAGNCNFNLHFSGPPQTSSFVLAYDFVPNYDIHDANWKASNGNRANWTKPVGLGEGPLHSPMIP
jgi:hypothetical protein